jgi:hypothetical protein
VVRVWSQPGPLDAAVAVAAARVSQPALAAAHEAEAALVLAPASDLKDEAAEAQASPPQAPRLEEVAAEEEQASPRPEPRRMEEVAEAVRVLWQHSEPQPAALPEHRPPAACEVPARPVFRMPVAVGAVLARRAHAARHSATRPEPSAAPQVDQRGRRELAAPRRPAAASRTPERLRLSASADRNVRRAAAVAAARRIRAGAAAGKSAAVVVGVPTQAQQKSGSAER